MKLQQQDAIADERVERFAQLNLCRSVCRSNEECDDLQPFFTRICTAPKTLEMKRKLLLACIDKVLELVEDDVMLLSSHTSETKIIDDL